MTSSLSIISSKTYPNSTLQLATRGCANSAYGAVPLIGASNGHDFTASTLWSQIKGTKLFLPSQKVHPLEHRKGENVQRLSVGHRWITWTRPLTSAGETIVMELGERHVQRDRWCVCGGGVVLMVNETRVAWSTHPQIFIRIVDNKGLTSGGVSFTG